MSILLPEARATPVEGVDFEFVGDGEYSLKIKLTSRGWKDLVYIYDYLKLSGPPDDAEPQDEFDDIDSKYNMVEDEPEEVYLKFNYQILENPNQCVTKGHPAFEMWLGDILSAILVDATTNENTKYSMFSKTDEGKIESLQSPITKPNLVGHSTKTVGLWGKLVGDVKTFFTGNK